VRSRDDPHAAVRARPADACSFALERFAWSAPDRLELAGTFAGLDGPLAELPVLILSGAGRTYRLSAAAADVSGAPENGRPWRAAFVWHEAPAAFESAVLQLGGELAVDLPEPGTDRAAPDNAELPVWVSSRDRSAPGAGAELLRLEAELLAAREELLETQSTLQRAAGELRRAREDLDSERAERAADAVRFRDGIAAVRESAQQALALEQRTAQQLRGALDAAQETLEAKDTELADARAELDVAATFRADAEAAAQAELAVLRERLEEARRRIRTALSAMRD
jgi:hypothetical protein